MEHDAVGAESGNGKGNAHENAHAHGHENAAGDEPDGLPSVARVPLPNLLAIENSIALAVLQDCVSLIDD